MKSYWILGGIAVILSGVACSERVPVTAPSAISVASDATLAGAAAPSWASRADATPFRGTFDGTQTVTPLPPFPPTSASVDVTASGTSTHLGRFTMELPHIVDFTTSSATGTATITAASGDTIVATFTGHAVPGPVVAITEQATVVSGTGRFAGATGTFTITRLFVQADGVTTGTIEGTISAPGAAH
jgi:hypothetical protein